MNAIYRVAVILGLVACGQSWAVGPGSQYDNKNNCNANLTMAELTALQFGTFDATLGGSVVIDPTTGGSTAAGVTMIANGQPGVYELSLPPGYQGTCSWPLVITLPTSFTLAAGANSMTSNPVTIAVVSGTTPVLPTTTVTSGTITVNGTTITPASPLLIYVGGTVTATANQPGGNYTATFTITALY